MPKISRASSIAGAAAIKSPYSKPQAPAAGKSSSHRRRRDPSAPLVDFIRPGVPRNMVLISIRAHAIDASKKRGDPLPKWVTDPGWSAKAESWCRAPEEAPASHLFDMLIDEPQGSPVSPASQRDYTPPSVPAAAPYSCEDIRPQILDFSPLPHRVPVCTAAVEQGMDTSPAITADGASAKLGRDIQSPEESNALGRSVWASASALRPRANRSAQDPDSSKRPVSMEWEAVDEADSLANAFNDLQVQDDPDYTPQQSTGFML